MKTHHIETIEEKVSSNGRNNKNGVVASMNAASLMVNKINSSNKSKDNSVINEYLSKGA
jgi:hypothetical protein